MFALGHWEYGKYTLAEEYERDMAKGMTNVPFPKNYFPHDDPKLEPLFAWRAHANLLWRNWLNWVYQTTPYDLTEVPQLRAEKKLGTDRSIRHEPGGPRQDDFKPFVHDGYGVIQAEPTISPQSPTTTAPLDGDSFASPSRLGPSEGATVGGCVRSVDGCSSTMWTA